MSKYKIWDKTSNIITPIGEVLTPQEWLDRYPVANYLDIVCGGGVINGAYFAVFEQFKESYAKMGCDFSNCVTKQDILDKIEEFEDVQNTPSGESSAEERIAAALETQVMMSMETVNDDDPDAE